MSETARYCCPLCRERFNTMESAVEHKNRLHLNRKVNSCFFCHLEFFTRHQVLVHVRDDHAIYIKSASAQLAYDVFLCPVCNEVFGKKFQFQLHMRKCHSSAGKHKCKKLGCNAGFFTRKELENHTCSDGEKPEAPKIRVISAAKFTDDDSAEEGIDRLMMSSEEEDEDEDEEEEDESQKIPLDNYGSGLPKHCHFLSNFKSSRRNNFECCECYSRFDNSDDLLSHLDQHQEAEKLPNNSNKDDFGCMICDFIPLRKLSESQRKQQVKDHIITAHFEARLPTSMICDPEVELTDAEEEISDTDVRSKDKAIAIRIRCLQCYKEFETESFLQIHMRYHHNKDSEASKQIAVLNECQKCHKTLPSESQLILHRNLYCEVSFECDFCNQTFTKIQMLAKHVRFAHKINGREVIDQQNGEGIAGIVETVHRAAHVVCRYPGCTKTFPGMNTREFLAHEALEHSGAVLTRKENGKSQSIVVHRVSPPPRKLQKLQSSEFDDCPFCEKKIRNNTLNATSQALLRHLINSHKFDCAQKGGKCNKCPFTTSNISLFVDHFKKHFES